MILYRAFHTTKESRRESQPHVSPSGAVITWDGRLDNRAELISGLRDFWLLIHRPCHRRCGLRKWGADSFAKLIGIGRSSIWNPNNRSLISPKTPSGPAISIIQSTQARLLVHHP